LADELKRGVEGSGRGLTEVLGATEESHKNPRSGYPVSRMGFEPDTSQFPTVRFTVKQAANSSSWLFVHHENRDKFLRNVDIRP
jgi:hypothetical protein